MSTVINYRSSASVRSGHVTGAVKVSEIFMRGFSVAGSELVGEGFRADSVDGAGEVAVGDGRVSGLDGPQRLAESADRGRRIEDDFGAVDAVHHPILRVMPAVADVHGDSPVLGVEHPVAGVALHVVGGLVEVAHPRDVVLAGLADHFARVGDDDRGVPENVAVILVALQNGRNDDHVVLLGVTREELRRGAFFSRFREFAPRLLFSGAKSERHG